MYGEVCGVLRLEKKYQTGMIPREAQGGRNGRYVLPSTAEGSQVLEVSKICQSKITSYISGKLYHVSTIPGNLVQT